MYTQAYELIREILDDEALNDFVFDETGKHLAVIDAGAQVTIPAVKITFTGGEISCSDNVQQLARYSVEFALPFWGADALEQCHKFLDVAVRAFFDHEQREIPGRINRVIRISPSITEIDEESEVWTVALDVAVSIFI
ncbi:MAG: hypothetical protein IJG39_10860 [Synergistaceae bacterium]|nr:hypothetical protein [Synergistaceae bacterium]